MKKKKAGGEKLRFFGGLGFPYGAFGNGVHIEINGNREALVDGGSSILEYGESCIKINTGKMLVAFKGRGLFIRCMSDSSLLIEGYISSVEYVR